MYYELKKGLRFRTLLEFLLMKRSCNYHTFISLVSTYEGVRHTLEQNNVTNTKVKAFVGGCCASVVGQTIIVPFDVISQHIMLIGLVEKRTSNVDTKTSCTSSQFVKAPININGGTSSSTGIPNLNKNGKNLSVKRLCNFLNLGEGKMTGR